MEHRRIGSLEVTTLGIGCNNFGTRLDQSQSSQVVDAAIGRGVNLFDTADVYGRGASEELLGRSLGSRRSQVVLATKLGGRASLDEAPNGAKPAHVKLAVEASLRRLGTDYIDLYQVHYPDPATPIEDTLGALADLVRDGKVREIGYSNCSVEDLRAAGRAEEPGRPRFVSVQNELSLLNRSAKQDVLPYCAQAGLAFLPYFPLSNGLLTGKYARDAAVPSGTRVAGFPEERRARLLSAETFDRVEPLAMFAEAEGRTLLELAFAWLLALRPVASVIAGASTAMQVNANADAVDWQLTADELARLDAV